MDKQGASRQEVLLRLAILGVIYILAYFNYRSTMYLVEQGFYNFLNWFDDQSWYPLGRIVGGTVYPGLMVTAATIYNVLHSLGFPIVVRNVCVFTAPFFASNTTIAAYLLTKEIKDSSAGLVAAALIAIVPGYISRSVAGSFDNEGIAIFALIFTYYWWVRSVNTGSIRDATIASLSFFYMVSAWGGYVFIVNLIPLHVLALLVTGRYSSRLYVAYSTFFTLGTMLAMQVTFVGFQAVQSSEHMASIGVFCLLQAYAFVNLVRSHLTGEQFARFVRLVVLLALAVGGAAITIGTATGYISPWTGRFYSLLDPTYAKKHIPIIASVSEHQPTTWASFFFDLHLLTFFVPAGMYFSFKKLTDANIFILLYGVTSLYFAGVMVRLMLVLAPVSCVLGAIGISQTLKTVMSAVKEGERQEAASGEKFGVAANVAKHRNIHMNPGLSKTTALALTTGIAVLLALYVVHCTWVTSEAYSSPSIVLAAKQHDGSRVIFDDFREAYYWLRQNTAVDAKVFSWWDYGYQLSSMANRTILVDNNTWNNTHIAQVGMAFGASEDEAYEMLQRMDVDYVLVLFGGLTGYSSDDINKFLWMIRIAGSVDPTISDQQYMGQGGAYRVDAGASPKLLDSLIYKTCYYRFGSVYTDASRPTGFDRVRQQEIGRKDIELTHLEEAFTSEHWLVRIYRVLPRDNLA